MKLTKKEILALIVVILLSYVLTYLISYGLLSILELDPVWSKLFALVGMIVAPPLLLAED